MLDAPIPHAALKGVDGLLSTLRPIVPGLASDLGLLAGAANLVYCCFRRPALFKLFGSGHALSRIQPRLSLASSRATTGFALWLGLLLGLGSGSGSSRGSSTHRRDRGGRLRAVRREASAPASSLILDGPPPGAGGEPVGPHQWSFRVGRRLATGGAHHHFACIRPVGRVFEGGQMEESFSQATRTVIVQLPQRRGPPQHSTPTQSSTLASQLAVRIRARPHRH